jgi:NAD+ diphosphatase
MGMLQPRNPNTFANYPLDRAGHRRKDAGWLSEALTRDDAQICAFRKDQPLVAEGASGLTPVWLGPAVLGLADKASPVIFLGLDASGAPHFAVSMGVRFNLDDSPLAGLGGFEDLRGSAPSLSDHACAILGCAKSLLDWHRRHRFCAHCGAPTDPAEGGWKRVCAGCATEHFPRVDPVVIMLPVRGDRALVGRQERFPPGMYSALAGFVEPGESLEEAVAREVLEEVGLTVRSARYLHAQPWPYPSQLMIGMIAEVLFDEDLVLEDEIAEAVWLTRAEASAALAGGATLSDGRRVFAPPRLAISHHLLKAWAEET